MSLVVSNIQTAKAKKLFPVFGCRISGAFQYSVKLHRLFKIGVDLSSQLLNHFGSVQILRSVVTNKRGRGREKREGKAGGEAGEGVGGGERGEVR